MTTWIVSSSLLILAVVLLRQLLRGKISRRLQYALWGIVLLRLLLPGSIGQTALSVMNAANHAPVVQDLTALEGYDQIWHTEPGTVEGWAADELMPDVPHVVVPHATEAEFDRMEALLDLRKFAKALWALGAAVVLLALADANGRFRRSLQDAERKEAEAEPLPVYVTDAVEAPCLFGLLAPAIYLPEAVWADPTARRHAVAHEITHYCHKDHIWAYLRCLALALHWYNPLVWLAAGLSRQDSELACDEGTIAQLGEAERIPYGNTLLDLTCGKRTPLCTATTMLDDKGQMRERITSIARSTKPWQLALVPVVVIAAVLAVSAFTGATENAETNEIVVTPVPTPKATVELRDDFTGTAVIPVELGNLTALMTVEFLYESVGEDYNIRAIREVSAENYSNWLSVSPEVTVDRERIYLNTSSGKAIIPITYYASIGEGAQAHNTVLMIGESNTPLQTSPDFQLTLDGAPAHSLKMALGAEYILQLESPSTNGESISCYSDDESVALIRYIGTTEDGKLQYAVTGVGIGHANVSVATDKWISTVQVRGISAWAESSPTPDYNTPKVVQPEDFAGLYQLTFHWEPHTLFDTFKNSGDIGFQYPDERITFIEDLMLHSKPLSAAPGCPMDVTMEVYTRSSHFTIQLPSDTCPVWSSEGVYYIYDAPDNTDLYSIFAAGTIGMAMKSFTAWELFPLLPYLDWTRYQKRFFADSESTDEMMNALQSGVMDCEDVSTRIARMKLVMQCTRGLTPELEPDFGRVLANICEIAPGQFAQIALEELSDQDREIVIRLLADAWDTNLYRARSVLEDYRAREMAPAPSPTPLTIMDDLNYRLTIEGAWTQYDTGAPAQEQTISFGEDGNGTWITVTGDRPAVERRFTYGQRKDDSYGGQLSLYFEDGTTEHYQYLLTNHAMLLVNNNTSITLEKVQ